MSEHHPLFARLYPRGAAAIDEAGSSEHRCRLLAGLSGRVVEVGAGHGLNFARYPTTVTAVTAVEPEPYLRRLAEDAARSAPVPIRLVDGRAESLPLEDDSVDAAVVSLVLCSVSDQAIAVAELRRVVRVGGELRFYEHVLAGNPKLAAWQRRLDPIWRRVAGRCRLTCDTEGTIRQAGFVVDELDRFIFSPCLPAKLTAEHVLGRAHR